MRFKVAIAVHPCHKSVVFRLHCACDQDEFSTHFASPASFSTCWKKPEMEFQSRTMPVSRNFNFEIRRGGIIPSQMTQILRGMSCEPNAALVARRLRLLKPKLFTEGVGGFTAQEKTRRHLSKPSPDWP